VTDDEDLYLRMLELEVQLRDLLFSDLNAFCQHSEIPGAPVTDDPDCEDFYPITTDLGEHHRLINNALMDVDSGECPRLMLFMPPGSAKSTYGSVTFPVWFLRKPGRDVISTSYGSDLARRFGRRCRQMVGTETVRRLYAGAEIPKGHNSADDWGLTSGGTYTGVGIMAGVTGKRADLLVIDDPVRNQEQAESEVMRQKVWDEYISSLRTRLKPGGRIVIIMTRWHPDDLAGRILPETWRGESGLITARDGEVWRVISLPAQAERVDDPLGREPGQWLWTDWFSPEHWGQTKRTVGTRVWEALYQQRPSPAEGGIIKRAWVKRFSEKPFKPDFIIQSWDTAYKDKEVNDPSACSTWCMAQGHFYLLHCFRGRLDYPSVKREITNLADAWKPHAVLIEDKASGQSLIQELRGFGKHSIVAIEPEGNKISRMNAVSALFESGRVHFPESAPWMTDLEVELYSFPLAKHDDQCDSISQALSYLSSRASEFTILSSGRQRSSFGGAGASRMKNFGRR